MLGDGRVALSCYDGVARQGLIRGTMRRRVWISTGDIVLIGLREFQEETGFDLNNIKLIENLNPYEELFIGSNLKSYKQKYYLAYTDNHDDNVLENYQKSEVSKMGWFNIDECNDKIRPYNCEKKNLINQVHNTIINYESKILN